MSGDFPGREIYLVRHGETQWNAAGRFQGQLDSPLTDRGKAQAAAYGRTLAPIASSLGTLAASPLGRVRETTDILRSAGDFPAPRWEPLITEVSLGSWDGLTHDDIDAMWPDRLNDATRSDWFLHAPDGENYEDARARATAWLDGVSGAVLAVSHGLIGRMIRGAYLGLSREETVTLPVPQDVIWHLADGRITPIPTH